MKHFVIAIRIPPVLVIVPDMILSLMDDLLEYVWSEAVHIRALYY